MNIKHNVKHKYIGNKCLLQTAGLIAAAKAALVPNVEKADFAVLKRRNI